MGAAAPCVWCWDRAVASGVRSVARAQIVGKWRFSMPMKTTRRRMEMLEVLLDTPLDAVGNLHNEALSATCDRSSAFPSSQLYGVSPGDPVTIGVQPVVALSA